MSNLGVTKLAGCGETSCVETYVDVGRDPFVDDMTYCEFWIYTLHSNHFAMARHSP